MSKKIICAPSILSADFSAMGTSLAVINESCAEYIHIDVMDGSFVPEISFGQDMVKSLRPLSNKVFDVHLMVENPAKHYDSFAKAGADIITFHIEAVCHAHREIQHIHDLGLRAGVAIVPSTPLAQIEELLPFVDLVLIMSVNPGFGGQALIPQTLTKITRLIERRTANKQDFLVSIDGGVNAQTIKEVKASGVDVVVSGSAFFGAQDPIRFLSDLQNC